jgi:multiple sugar transport system ATP-binding protein
MATVKIENLVKTYPGERGRPGKTVVDHVNIDIRHREFMVLVGPSGCGKSTTLRMIAGLEDITSGAIYIEDRKVNEVAPKDRDIAMVFQNYALYPHMSVRENLAFGLKLRGFPREEIHRRVQEAAKILGLLEPDNLLDRKPKALSGGQRQRVALGRAMVRQPKAFLFDEPLSNLDAKMRVEMRAEITRLHRRLQSTMVYVTHDQVEAMTMADRMVVMHQGRVQQIATPLEIYRHPANRFVAGFIGSPPMNFLHGSLVGAGDRLAFREKTPPGSAPAVQVVLPPESSRRLAPNRDREIVQGIRPEHLEEANPEEPAAWEAVVDLVEPMGAETFLHVHTGGHSLAIRSSAEESAQAQAGGRRRFRLDPDKVCFFDPTSGAALPVS